MCPILHVNVKVKTAKITLGLVGFFFPSVFVLVEVLEAVKLFLHGVYYDCKIACQDVQGGSKKGTEPAGPSIWTGFQILIKKHADPSRC